jgi:pantoate--beta-alanine ligase
MNVHNQADKLHFELRNERSSGMSIGFVPTMGALHPGHLSLIERAKEENDTVVVSIFVNPKQFGEAKDLDTYPRPIDSDKDLLVQAGVDYLFLPEYGDVYPESFVEEHIDLGSLEYELEGASRPGHFQGVAQVIKRFFEIIEPDRSYFGQKDFQQTAVIRRLIELFDFPVKLVVCPIIRESHGLAMSSRNERLSDEKRQKASFIYKSLLKLKERLYFKSIDDAVRQTQEYMNSIDGARVDYLAIVDGRTMKVVQNMKDSDFLVAVTVVEYGGVRLLDNLILKSPV